MTVPLLYVLLGITGAVISISKLLESNPRIARRISGFVQATSGTLRFVQDADDGSQDEASQQTSSLLPFRNCSEAFQRRLKAAGIYNSEAEAAFRIAQVAAVVLGALGCGWLSGILPLPTAVRLLFSVAGGLAGFLAPSLWLNQRTARRKQDIGRSLPDLLDLFVSCLDAGVTLEAVLKRVNGENLFAGGALRDEMRRVHSDVEFGAPVDKAILNLAERAESEDIHTLGIVCQQARRHGTQICEGLRSLSDKLREKREQAAEEHAQKAGVRVLAPTLLCLFPVIFVVLAGPAAIQIHENLTETTGSAD